MEASLLALAKSIYYNSTRLLISESQLCCGSVHIKLNLFCRFNIKTNHQPNC